MKPLKLFIAGEEITTLGEPIKMPIKETPEFNEGEEWKLSGAKLIDAEKHLYSGKFQYYYRRGNKVFFRGCNMGKIQKVTTEMPNESISIFLKSVKFKSIVTLNFTTE